LTFAAPIGNAGLTLHSTEKTVSIPPRPLSTRRVQHTLHTLILASFVCLLMWAVRVYVGHGIRFAGFIWNLFLAWIPLGLAFAIRRRLAHGHRGVWLWVLAVAWLLFFPNAFYIVTDLIHLKKFGTDHVPPWYDLLMTMAFACGGMFLGCLSLYLLHLTARERFGWRVGWLFAGTMLALGALGVYLGRFSRLNSWDIVARPLHLLDEVTDLAVPPERHMAFAFTSAFFLFSLVVYAFVVSMTRIHEIEESAPTSASRLPE
jgi:uncharacterized membrane protein